MTVKADAFGCARYNSPPAPWFDTFPAPPPRHRPPAARRHKWPLVRTRTVAARFHSIRSGDDGLPHVCERKLARPQPRGRLASMHADEGARDAAARAGRARARRVALRFRRPSLPRRGELVV